MKSRKPWLLSVSGPLRLAWALPKSPNRIGSISWVRARVSRLRPELVRGEARAFRQAGQLRPYNGRIDRSLADPGTVAAIASGDDIFAADEPGVAGYALGNQFGVLDKIGLRFDDTGDQHLAVGQFHVLEDLPFMRMTRVGRLEGEAARPGQKDGFDDVPERHVAMMRAFVIAPAEVQTQLLRRDVLQRMIERLDMEPGLFAEFTKAQLGILNVPAHGEVRTVDLQDQTGLGDGLVFLPHSLGDRVEIGLLARIMPVVEEQRDDTRRGGTEEGFLRVHSGERQGQISDVYLGRLGVAHADRTIAAGCPAPRAAGIAKDPAGEFWKPDEILVDERSALAAKSVQPVLDVGRVARLAHLTVIDDVDAGLDLLFDDRRHRRSDARLERRHIDRHPFLFGEHRAHEIVRTGQAAGMRRQEALGAAFHGGIRAQWRRGMTFSHSSCSDRVIGSCGISAPKFSSARIPFNPSSSCSCWRRSATRSGPPMMTLSRCTSS